MRSQSKIVARYAETDQMGVVHHAVYPVWYEVARTEWIKKLSISYSEMEKMGIMLPLSGLTCQYLVPVRYEDEVIVEAFVQKLTPFQVVFGYEVFCDGVLVSTGTTSHGWTNLQLKPMPLKRTHPDLYQLLLQNVE